MILIADNEEHLQSMIHAFQQYCIEWRLTINHNKTQVMHFRMASKPRSMYNFKYTDKQISKMETYKYLGMHINYNLDIGKTVETFAQPVVHYHV